MRRYKTLSKTVAALSEGAMFEYSTDLQLMTALQVISLFPTPFIPHIGEFTELASILTYDKRRGHS